MPTDCQARSRRLVAQTLCDRHTEAAESDHECASPSPVPDNGVPAAHDFLEPNAIGVRGVAERVIRQHQEKAAKRRSRGFSCRDSVLEVLPKETTSPSMTAARSERAEILHRILEEHCTETERELFLLWRVDDRSPSEIAGSSGWRLTCSANCARTFKAGVVSRPRGTADSTSRAPASCGAEIPC